MSDYVNLLKNIEIVQGDGSTRKMTDDEAQGMQEVLEAAAVRFEEERPRMEAVIARLNESIPELEIEQLGGNVPIQGEGTYQGEEFYFRSRYTHASLAVGSTDGEEVSSWNPRRYATIRVTAQGDDYGAGWLTPEEVEIVFPILIEQLREMTQEENESRLAEFHAAVDAMVENMRSESEDDN